MRRADHLTNTERALTLALVLVAAGCAPTSLPCRDLVLPRTASASSTPAPAALRQEAAQPGDLRNASHEVELLARTNAAATSADETGARRTTPYRSTFLAPPSQRGPPALG
jgi:hypothetical protein